MPAQDKLIAEIPGGEPAANPPAESSLYVCPVRRPRMKDIAKAVDLAVITVSKALRNHPDISRKTRERIWAKAREMNYTPNLAARSLVTQRSYVIGVVVPDLSISYFAEVAKAIAGELRQAGYDLFLSNSEEDPVTEAQEIERLLGRQVDGLIVATSFPAKENSLFESLLARGVPFVQIDRTVERLNAPFVGTNDRTVGSIATAHLVQVGCKRIAHLKGPETSTGIGRHAGYRRVLREAGLPATAEIVESGGTSVEGGCAGMQRLLERKPRPDGVFCYNDLVAAGALRACFENRLRVPKDVAIIGCGNHCLTDLLQVSLSTVDQHTARIGLEAARLMLEKFTENAPAKSQRILIPPTIVIRESTRR
jgi:LacI family transcriptional regulator